MRLSRLLSVLFLSASLLASAACDSDNDTNNGTDTGGDTGGNTDTGGNDDTPMTGAQLKAECEALSTHPDIESFFQNQAIYSCYYSGSMSDSCPDSVSQCMDEYGEEGLSFACDEIPANADCSATRQEFLACFMDLSAKSAEIVEGVTCENAYERLVETDHPTPASCETLQSKCPAAFGGSSDGEDFPPPTPDDF